MFPSDWGTAEDWSAGGRVSENPAAVDWKNGVPLKQMRMTAVRVTDPECIMVGLGYDRSVFSLFLTLLQAFRTLNKLRMDVGMLQPLKSCLLHVCCT